MKISCKKIQLVHDLAIQNGYQLKDIQKGWSESIEVYVLDKNLSKGLQENISDQKLGLKYWDFSGSTIDTADEGYKCTDCSIAISFPKNRQYIR